MQSINVRRAERDHWKTGEEMVSLYFAHNDHQTERIDMTVPEARTLLEALEDHLHDQEIKETIERTVLAMTALRPAGEVTDDLLTEVRNTVIDALDNAS